MLIFDIETGPLPDDELELLLPPFDESPYFVGEFDPSSVKLGNMKDEAKIADKIESARIAHEDRAARSQDLLEDARDKHWADFKGNAALSATTGRVICIAYYSPEKRATRVVGVGDSVTEQDLLQEFWSQYERMRKSKRRMAGLNIIGFDLPFLVRRSWIQGVDVPASAFERWKHRINWSDVFLDIRQEWLLGEYGQGTRSSFDHIASAFGTPGKTDGVTGADFARLWTENNELARQYVANDVQQPALWLERMGLLAASE